MSEEQKDSVTDPNHVSDIATGIYEGPRKLNGFASDTPDHAGSMIPDQGTYLSSNGKTHIGADWSANELKKLDSENSEMPPNSDVKERSVSTVDSDDSSSDSGDDEVDDAVFDYTRLSKVPPAFFVRDLVSTAFALEGLLVLASHSGAVHLQKDGMPLRTVRNHRASILDIDCDGKYVATASIDGTVVIASIDDPRDVTTASFRRPVHAIALHPEFQTTKIFVTGGTAGQVVLSEPGWLRSRSEKVLAQGLGTITSLAWKANQLVWTNDDGISVYDIATGSIVQRIPRLPNSPPPDLYRPHTHWLTRRKIVVGWGDTLWTIDLSEGSSTYVCPGGLIAGVAALNDDILVLTQTATSSISLKLLESEWEDELELRGTTQLGVNDCHLTGGSPNFYVVAATDAVQARERGPEDHIEWLRLHSRPLEALEVALNYGIDPGEVALEAAGDLLKLNLSRRAAELLSEYLNPDDVQAWHAWAEKFPDFEEFGDFLPLSDLNGLHDDALKWAASHSVAKMQKWLTLWPTTLYNPRDILPLAPPVSGLSERVGDIWLELAEPLPAANALLSVQSERAPNIVAHYHLWDKVQISKVLQCGGDASSMLVDARLEISPQTVVSNLMADIDRPLLFDYLEKLGGREFADLRVKLYSEFDHERLSQFLRRSEVYDIQLAISECEKRGYDSDLVYLLGRVGQTTRALSLILGGAGSARDAVAFAENYKEPELWQQLLSAASGMPELVLELLGCVQVSPARVLAQVPSDMRIPGLRKALIRVFEEQETDLILGEGALAIVRTESKSSAQEIRRLRHLGIEIDPEACDLDWSCPQKFPGGKVETLEGQLPDLRHGESWISYKVRHLGWLFRQATA